MTLGIPNIVLRCWLGLALLFFGCREKQASVPNPNPIQERVVKVGLQPFARFDVDLLADIGRAIDSTYGFEVVALERLEMPELAFVHVKSPRYRADSMLRVLRRNKSADLDFVMGLTSSDISTTKRQADGTVKKPASKYGDWGIFGYGFRPGPASIVSTFRLGTLDKGLLRQRLRKICLHELGHNLGLPHCTSGLECLMQDAAETIKTIDGVEEALCVACQKTLQSE